MDTSERNRLEKLALERRNASAADVEQWSFLFRTEGAVEFSYCPWSETEDLEFDGSIDGLDLPWSPDRIRLINSGEADPDEDELIQWQQAKCGKLAKDLEAWMVWVVPIIIEGAIAGYALFLGHSNDDQDDAPGLEGVFDSVAEAISTLEAKGVVR